MKQSITFTDPLNPVTRVPGDVWKRVCKGYKSQDYNVPLASILGHAVGVHAAFGNPREQALAEEINALIQKFLAEAVARGS